LSSASTFRVSPDCRRPQIRRFFQWEIDAGGSRGDELPVKLTSLAQHWGTGCPCRLPRFCPFREVLKSSNVIDTVNIWNKSNPAPAIFAIAGGYDGSASSRTDFGAACPETRR